MQLLLYFPWRREREGLLTESYQETYMTKQDIIQGNRKTFEHFADEVIDVLDTIQELGVPEESWHILAPESEKERLEEEFFNVHTKTQVYSVLLTHYYNLKPLDQTLQPHLSMNFSLKNYQQSNGTNWYYLWTTNSTNFINFL